MNFFDARLVNENGKYSVDVDGLKVELSEDKQERLKAKDVKDQDITLGVRPEHLMLGDTGIHGVIDVAELMGSSTHLHINADGKDIVAIATNESGHINAYTAGTDVQLSFKGNAAHVFCKESGTNLEW